MNYIGYISEEITKHGMSGKLLLSTKKDAVLSNRPGYDVSALQPCNHPEADTWIFLHLAHAEANGHKKTVVWTVDSDVVILAIRFFNTLGLTELWTGFAGGKNYRDIPAHEISKYLGPQKSLALPLFHASKSTAAGQLLLESGNCCPAKYPRVWCMGMVSGLYKQDLGTFLD